MRTRILITGTGAICASGADLAAIWEELRAGRSAVRPIASWDASGWPAPVAGEVAGLDPGAIVEERKVHKLLERTDFLGLHAVGGAVRSAGLAERRAALEPDAAARFNERSGVFVASSGGRYANQYDYFPLLTAARGDLRVFGRELDGIVTPMWLLRTLPNNVLCHAGIRHGLKGSNACLTNHGAGGLQALAEAVTVLREGEADRAVVVAHSTPVEPQAVLYYGAAGLLAPDAVRPFDAARRGTVLGEGAAALVVESEESAHADGARVLGEVLGCGSASEGEGLLAVREDGDGPGRAMAAALGDAGVTADQIGLIVARGEGGRLADAAEARAIRRLFGRDLPPITAWKWACGNLLDPAGLLEALLALVSIARGEAPGVATLEHLDPECEGLPIAREKLAPRSDLALVLAGGFGGVYAALVLRGMPGGWQ